MAPNLAILTTLTTLFLFSGCIGDSGTAPSAPAPNLQADDAAQNVTAPADEPVAPTPATQACTTNTNNYGIATTVAGYHIYSRRGGNTLVVYKESNSISGLQTEEECATPDAKIAEVPDTPAMAPAKCDGTQSTVVYGQFGDPNGGEHYIAGTWGESALVVYHESNGVKGLQSAGPCQNPDTKVADVAGPLVHA